MTNIRRPILLLALAATLTLALPAAADHPAVRSLRQEIALGDATKIHAKLSIGDMVIEGTDGGKVEVELTLDCSRVDAEVCKTRAERVRLAPRMAKGELRVKLKNTPKARLRGIQARMVVRIPRHLPVEVDVTAGTLKVSGMQSSLNLNSGGGDVEVKGSRGGTGEVDIDIGFGKADLWLGEERIKGTGWPRALNWTGTGDATIDIDVVGSGNVTVRLE